MNKHIIGFLGKFLFLIFILTSCEEELATNLLDPDDPDYEGSPSSLRVFPQLTNANLNTPFSVDIYAEDVSDILLIQIEIEYDNQYMEYNNNGIAQGELLDNFSGGNIFIDQVISSNTIQVTIGGLESGADGGLDGTGSLFSISFTAIASNAGGDPAEIVIKSAEFQTFVDGSNTEIVTINQIDNGQVNIQ